MTRVAAVTIGFVLIGALLAGCGGSSSALPVTTEATTPVEPSAETKSEEEGSTASTNSRAEEELSSHEPEVGTISVSNGRGTGFVDHYKIGPLIYSQQETPPKEVLEACNLDYQSQIAKAVFARGQVSVDYSVGSLPEQISLAPAVMASEPSVSLQSVVAFRINGEWECRQEEMGTYEVQPHEVRTYPIWFIAEEVLTNEQPRISTETRNSWYFPFIGPPLLQEQGKTKMTGPGAGRCESTERLYLYNRSGKCEERSGSSGY